VAIKWSRKDVIEHFSQAMRLGQGGTQKVDGQTLLNKILQEAAKQPAKEAGTK
jgi:hypothetical protein